MRAGEVDLAHHTLAEERARAGFHHLGDELVTGCSGERVIAALEFEIGMADAAGQQAQEGEPLRTRRNRQRAGGDCAIRPVNRDQPLYHRASCLRNWSVSKSGPARGLPLPRSFTIARNAAVCWKRCTASRRSPPM